MGVCRVNNDPPTPIVASNSRHIQRNVALNLSLSMDISAKDSQFVESHVVEVVQHNSRRFQNEIMDSGQMFSNADVFRVVYLMSIVGRFRYCYKKNSFKHMTIICMVNDFPWKITCRAMGALHLVQVHTFVNEHRHTINDLVYAQPLVRCDQAPRLLMMPFDVHSNACHKKFVKTSFGNMGCV